MLLAILSGAKTELYWALSYRKVETGKADIE
jgi:hypothetical protein